MHGTVCSVLVLLLFINCSLNGVKTPRKVCANSPYSKGKTNKKPIKGNIEAAHVKAADKWASPARARGRRGKLQPAALRRCSPHRERRCGDPAAVLCCRTVVTEEKPEILPVQKKNTRGGCHLNVIIQPGLSIHPPDSSRESQQFMSVLNHMERCKMSAVMTALMAPSGAS